MKMEKKFFLSFPVLLPIHFYILTFFINPSPSRFLLSEHACIIQLDIQNWRKDSRFN
jgi:hypothetical protein